MQHAHTLSGLSMSAPPRTCPTLASSAPAAFQGCANNFSCKRARLPLPPPQLCRALKTTNEAIIPISLGSCSKAAGMMTEPILPGRRRRRVCLKSLRAWVSVGQEVESNVVQLLPGWGRQQQVSQFRSGGRGTQEKQTAGQRQVPASRPLSY